MKLFGFGLGFGLVFFFFFEKPLKIFLKSSIKKDNAEYHGIVTLHRKAFGVII